MIMHSCWCICFIGMSAQGLNSKVHLNSNRFGVSKELGKKKGRKWKSKCRSQPAQPAPLSTSAALHFPSAHLCHRPPPLHIGRPASAPVPRPNSPHRPPSASHRPTSASTSAAQLASIGRPASTSAAPLPSAAPAPHHSLTSWSHPSASPSSPLLLFFPAHRPPEISGEPPSWALTPRLPRRPTKGFPSPHGTLTLSLAEPETPSAPPPVCSAAPAPLRRHRAVAPVHPSSGQDPQQLRLAARKLPEASTLDPEPCRAGIEPRTAAGILLRPCDSSPPVILGPP
jgi:hypothetical protein